MPDPYSVLDLERNATAEQVRRRYLELARTYTPEQHPQKFAEIQEAYQQLRDPAKQLERTLFEPETSDTIDDLIAKAQHRLVRRRLPTELLLQLDAHGE